MSKLEELLNNLYVNISLINNETIRDKSLEDLEIIRKVLEVIIKKHVNLYMIKDPYFNKVSMYNRSFLGFPNRKLTKEEFILLKKVIYNFEIK